MQSPRSGHAESSRPSPASPRIPRPYSDFIRSNRSSVSSTSTLALRGAGPTRSTLGPTASSSCTKLPTKHHPRALSSHTSAERQGTVYAACDTASTPRFSRLLGTVLGPSGSPSSSASASRANSSIRYTYDRDNMADISAPQSRATTRSPSPDFSIISPPSPTSAVFIEHQDLVEEVSDNGLSPSSMSTVAPPSPAKGSRGEKPSRGSSPMRRIPLARSQSSRNGKGLLPRLWDALSSSGKKGKEKMRVHDDGLPLDGEEGELIDDEACFINVSPLTGIDIISLLPTELSLQLLRFLDLPSILACLQVSKHWRRLAQDNTIWRGLFYNREGWKINTAAAKRRVTMHSNSIPSMVGNGSRQIQLDHMRHRKRSSAGTASIHTFGGEKSGASGGNSPLSRISSRLSTESGRASNECHRDGNKEEIETAPLSLNWKELYKTRLEVDKRWGAGEPRMMRIAGHGDSVYCLEFDSQRIITGSRDKTIKIWSLRTGKLQATLRGHVGSVLCLKFDMKNGFMVSGSSDCTVLVWDLGKVRDKIARRSSASNGGGGGAVSCGKELVQRMLTGHAGGVLDLKIDKDWIVSCSKDALIRVWNRKTLSLFTTLRGHEGPVNAVGLQRGRVVSASGDGKMMLWDIATSERIRTFEGHDRGLACIEFKEDLIVSGSNDCKIKIWSASTGDCIRTLTGHALLVRALSFDPLSRRLVSASYDKTVKVWDLESGRMVREFRTSHTSHIFDVKFDACRIVSTSHDQKVVVLDFSHDLDTSLFI